MVCTGNLYRSPLAAGLLRQRLADPGRVPIGVTSAGTAADPGTPVPPAVTAILQSRGGDLAEPVARRLTTELVERADLVLGAAVEHREAAVRLAPARALCRAFTLREFALLLREEDAAGIADPAARLGALVRAAAARRGSVRVAGADEDVADPIGSDGSVLRACAARIEESVERIARAVLSGAGDGDRRLSGHSQSG
ncbi:low molecular weight phosphatase family protein [Streptomyces sp. WMMC500]|uniref:arsenate reductase/protein-tyrosine-phosphatase family protein n=1 Tax=Streptomyces sp. WMMC500 TaxID=3015154 RepID=UPI00248B3A3C|nr:low molecular weight phosphatase family protein [Streptomyces sp. WMMC500]WBB61990.1 low molecular weight phosphatase family protein [Streptomyces sp. WMMC500]